MKRPIETTPSECLINHLAIFPQSIHTHTYYTHLVKYSDPKNDYATHGKNHRSRTLLGIVLGDYHMTDTSPSSDETPPGMPRWVKVFVLIVILLILLVLITMFALGGDHGPGRHALGC